MEDAPQSKKPKNSISTTMQTDDEGNPFWEVCCGRRCSMIAPNADADASVESCLENDEYKSPSLKR